VSRSPLSTGLLAPKAVTVGKILAVDYGRARIGLAIAESARGIAQPLATLERINRNEDMRRLRELVRDNAVKLILVGLPLRLDGSRGEMAEETERFAQRVRKQIGVAVEMADERLTSWEAERMLEEEFGRKSKQIDGASKKKKDSEKITVDSVAATIILREYLARVNGASQEAG
jgi:putative pre-16S rRNA nuclease